MTPWDKEGAGLTHQPREAETGPAGRGTADNLICISQTRHLRFVCD